nr:epimerase [Bradyrhizobium sp. 138]
MGGSGIVGGYILERLVARGERPIAVSREIQQSPNVDWLRADLSAPKALQIEDVGTIYCTAHAKLLADALPCLITSNLRRVVAFTSTSLETKRDSELVEERKYVAAWAEAEAHLIEVCTKSGVGWTVLRPTLIYAEGRDSNVSRIAQLIQRLRFMPLAGEGLGLRQPVHAEDLAIGAINAAASPLAINKIYAVPGTDTVTYYEMVGRIFDGLKLPRRIISIPLELWRLAFLLGRPFIKSANAAMASRMGKDMVFDPAPAIADFDWKPRPFYPNFCPETCQRS